MRQLKHALGIFAVLFVPVFLFCFGVSGMAGPDYFSFRVPFWIALSFGGAGFLIGLLRELPPVSPSEAELPPSNGRASSPWPGILLLIAFAGWPIALFRVFVSTTSDFGVPFGAATYFGYAAFIGLLFLCYRRGERTAGGAAALCFVALIPTFFAWLIAANLSHSFQARRFGPYVEESIVRGFSDRPEAAARLRGKALIVRDRRIHSFTYRLPEHLRCRSPEQCETLISFDSYTEKVGQYTDGYEGSKRILVVMVSDLKERVTFRKLFESGPPEIKREGFTGRNVGMERTEEAFQWILQLPLAR